MNIASLSAIVALLIAIPIASVRAQPTEQRDYLIGCAPGPIVVTLKGLPTLYMDWTLLYPAGLQDRDGRILHGRSCPKEPTFKDEELWFSGPNVAKTLNIQGMWIYSLHIRGGLDLSQFGGPTRPPPPLAPAREGQPPALQASIKMTKPLGDLRYYDLIYPEPEGYAPVTVHIYCGGLVRAGRDCRISCASHPDQPRVIDPFIGGLPVTYILDHMKFPLPDEVSTDPDTEPGAVLQFDTRMRAWLLSLEQPPQ
jgi:hypothetical protein